MEVYREKFNVYTIHAGMTYSALKKEYIDELEALSLLKQGLILIRPATSQVGKLYKDQGEEKLIWIDLTEKEYLCGDLVCDMHQSSKVQTS